MRLNRISLLFLFLCSGCVVSNIGTTSPSVNEIKSASSTEVNNFNVLTEVTAIPTKKPWVYESPAPTPVPVNEYITGSGYAELNYKNGYESTPFEIKTNNQRLVSNNGYYKLDRKTRTIGLADGLAIDFSYSKSYKKPKCCWSTREIDLQDSFNGRVELELEKDTNNLSLKAKNIASASMFRKMTHYGGAYCYYSAMASVSLIPSGTLSYINKKIYGSLSYQAAGYYGSTDTLCGGLEPKNTDPSYKSGNASVSLSVNLPKEPPVDVEVQVDKINGKYNEIISPANKDGKFDKSKLLITTMAYDEWVLIAEGKDIYGNVRRYTEEGKGNKDLEFKGKTNDAIDPKNDMYFADGEVNISLISKKSGESSGGRVLIDNTPPEVITNSLSSNGSFNGTVIDKFPDNEKLTKNNNAVSGLDETSIPSNISFKGENKNASVQLTNDNFQGTVSGIEQGEDLETYQYGINGAIETSVEDKVGNVYSPISVTQDSTNDSFETKAAVKEGLQVAMGVFAVGKKTYECFKGDSISIPSEYEILTGEPFTMKPVIGLCDPNPVAGKYEVTAKLKISGGVSKKYTVVFKPYKKELVNESRILDVGLGSLKLPFREWYGRTKGVLSFQENPSNTLKVKEFYDLSDENKLIINNIFGGSELAEANKTGFHKVVLDIEKIDRILGLGVKYKVSGKRSFQGKFKVVSSVKSLHDAPQDFNKSYEIPKISGTRESEKKDRQYHIRVGHDINFVHPRAFVAIHAHLHDPAGYNGLEVLKDIVRSKITESNKNKKGTCFNTSLSVDDMFKSIEQVAQSRDLLNSWTDPSYANVGSGESIFVDSFKRNPNKASDKDYVFVNNHIITVLLKKNDSGKFEIDSGFPNEYHNLGIIPNKVGGAIPLMNGTDPYSGEVAGYYSRNYYLNVSVMSPDLKNAISKRIGEEFVESLKWANNNQTDNKTGLFIKMIGDYNTATNQNKVDIRIKKGGNLPFLNIERDSVEEIYNKIRNIKYN